MASTHQLEPPTADQRLIWDIYFAAHIMPLVAVCDELNVFSLLAETPLSSEAAAAPLGVTAEWAEVLLGALAAVQLLRVQDKQFHLTDAARSFLLPAGPYYMGYTLRRFSERSIFDRLKLAVHSARKATDPVPVPAGTASTPGSVYVVREWQAGELSLERAEQGARTMHGLSFPAAVALARNADFAG
jgi:hypothetical protein